MNELKVGPIDFVRCWTGRRWINIGKGQFAVGFGPDQFIERITWRRRYVYVARNSK